MASGSSRGREDDSRRFLMERNATVAEAGEGKTNLTTTLMQTNSPFSLANRKQLADMLGNQYEGLRYRARQKFRQKEHALNVALVREFAEKKGALKLVAQIEAANSKIEDLKADLSTLGFELDGTDLSIRYGSSNPLRKVINERIEIELGSESAIDARFDSAQVAMMTVASLEDAEKLLKSVSEI